MERIGYLIWIKEFGLDINDHLNGEYFIGLPYMAGFLRSGTDQFEFKGVV